MASVSRKYQSLTMSDILASSEFSVDEKLAILDAEFEAAKIESDEQFEEFRRQHNIPVIGESAKIMDEIQTRHAESRKQK